LSAERDAPHGLALCRDVVAAGARLDVFIADDDAQAKASVSAFIKSLGLHLQHTGDLSMAHWLEARACCQ
jgi:predicted dinucleotide-binding enzyme